MVWRHLYWRYYGSYWKPDVSRRQPYTYSIVFILIKLNWRHFIRPSSSIPCVCVVNSYLPAGRLLFWTRRPFSVTILNNSVVSFLIIGERWVEFKWLLVEDSLREFLIETHLIVDLHVSRFLFVFFLASKWLTPPLPRNWKLDSRSSRKPPTASLCWRSTSVARSSTRSRISRPPSDPPFSMSSNLVSVNELMFSEVVQVPTSSFVGTFLIPKWV